MKKQPKSRLTSASYLKNLKLFEEGCEKLYDICACKCEFAFDSRVKEDAIPCVGAWKSEVQCSCPLENCIHPRELKFLLDQRTYREMTIGQRDKHVTAQNKAILHNRHHRRDEGESSAHQ